SLFWSARSARPPPASLEARSCAHAPRQWGRNRQWPRTEPRRRETFLAADGLEALPHAIGKFGVGTRHLARAARIYRLCKCLVATAGTQIDAVVMQRAHLLRRHVLAGDVVAQRR